MLELRINKILQEKDLTMYWLSKQTGISPNNISNICNGNPKSIRLDTLEKISNALDCSIYELFETDDKEEQRLLAYAEKLFSSKLSDD